MSFVLSAFGKKKVTATYAYCVKDINNNHK